VDLRSLRHLRQLKGDGGGQTSENRWKQREEKSPGRRKKAAAVATDKGPLPTYGTPGEGTSARKTSFAGRSGKTEKKMSD